MKKIIVTAMAAGLVAGVASAEVSTTLDIASAYVFRGVTLNDGAVVQPGIEASGFGLPEECGSISAGAWGNYDLNDYSQNGAVGSSFVESDWYASYSLPSLVDGLDLSVGYCEYAYAGGASDKEVNVGAGYEIAGVSLGVTYYQGVGGLIHQQKYVEFDAGYGFDISEELSASVDASAGYLDPSVAGESGFSDYSVGASLSYALSEKWSAGVSATYIGQIDDKVLPDTTASTVGYDTSFVGMFSLACDM